MKPILFRARGGPRIGEGHVVRSRAVAEEVRAAGGDVLFVVESRERAQRLREEGFEAVSALDQPDWPSIRCEAAWIDGFADWSDELRLLARQDARTLLVENRTPARERCDLLIYPALHYRADRWDQVHAERVRAGAGVIPLRRSIRTALPALQRDVDLLVTFGGSDPLRLTERVLERLPRGLSHLAVGVGPHMEARREAILQRAEAAGARRLSVLAAGTDLAPWMARSAVAVTALGTTLYELAYLGVPALILANYASDRGPLEHYAEHGPHVPLGIHTELSDADLARGLSVHVGGLRHVPRATIPGLGEGATVLASLLLEERRQAA